MAIAQILLRGGTSAEWSSANPILAARELAVDTTVKRAKLGDGVTPFMSLPWITMDAAEVASLTAAADALAGATSVTDAAMTNVATTPGSSFASALSSTFVAATDEAGAPIPGYAARVTFNGDGDPVNIELVEVS